MTKKNKVIKLETIKDKFEIKNRRRIMTNSEIWRTFYKTLLPTISGVRTTTETLFRIGESHEPTKLEIRLPVDPRTRGKVMRVHTPDFSRLALEEAEKYRIILGGQADGIYEVVTNPKLREGRYVLTQQQEPILGVRIDPTKYTSGTMIFAECYGPTMSKYTPNLEKTPIEVIIETHVLKRARGEKGILIKKLFQKFHSDLVKKHIEITS